MKTIGALVSTILLLIFLTLTAASAYSQDREESSPEAKPSQQQKDKGKEKDKAAKPDEGKSGQEQPAARPQEQRSGEQAERGHAQGQVKAQRGKRIPDEKFRASFGRQHTFHVQRTQIVNVSQPTIVYGGYTFLFVDPWPTVWAFDDVVYVDFVGDEYFLFDPLYPGIRVALVVVE